MAGKPKSGNPPPNLQQKNNQASGPTIRSAKGPLIVSPALAEQRQGERAPKIPQISGYTPWTKPSTELGYNAVQIYGPGYAYGAPQRPPAGSTGPTSAQVYTARYKGLANYYANQGTANTPTQTTPGTFNQDRANLANAARYSGSAIFQYGARPDTITTRIAAELPWQSAGFKSPEDFLANIGYREDPSQPGVWNAYDPGKPAITGDTSGSGEIAYPDYGGGGYGGYGDGGGDRSYGSGMQPFYGGMDMLTWNIHA